MPLFARRRLQSMLDTLAGHLEVAKLKDIHARLESKRVDQALPAEVELGVIWALSQMGAVEVEPSWFGGRRPDVFTAELFETPAVVEITALSDARLAQEDV